MHLRWYHLALVLLLPAAVMAAPVSPGDRAIITKTLGSELDDLDPGRDLDVTKTDLNGDKESDYVVVCTSSIYCGSGGCSAWVLMSDHGHHRNVFPPLLVFTITVAETRTLGVHDLTVTGRGGDGPLRLKWDGKRYPFTPPAK